jgi:hypothetical protein
VADLRERAGVREPGQVAAGCGIVQIKDVCGSHIEVTVTGGEKRRVPLEPAIVPVGERVRSPMLLVKARSGVVPFTARADLAGELEGWLTAGEPFYGLVVGGRGGSGKTRLAVELCERARNKGWELSGLLTRIADQGALDALTGTQLPRLVVVDYAETRAEQLEILLPELAASATREAPVRVLMLIRASQQGTDNWTTKLSSRSDWLDALLGECDTRTLEDEPLDSGERERLFARASEAFAKRADLSPRPAAPNASLLSGEAFGTPLMVVVAAYLDVHGRGDLPATRDALFDEILKHEERYWQATGGGLFSPASKLPRRVAALATLATAETPALAVETLRLLPQLSDAPRERLDEISDWAHKLYPGAGWWNPLEPDRIGEHLVATAFREEPEIIAEVLATNRPERITWPLTILSRAAADHPQTNRMLRPILTDSLQHLCELAIAQASSTTMHELIYGEAATAAAAIENAIMTIPVDPDVLPGPVGLMPTQANLILASLAVTLAEQHVQHQQRLAEADPATYEPELAHSLNDFSVDLANAGLRERALQAIRQSVTIRERLAELDPATYEPELARSLSNLSNGLGEAGERERALQAIRQSVTIRERLAEVDPAAYEPELANSLNNLSIRLAEVGEQDQALQAIRQAVAIRKRLAEANPADYEPALAGSLNNLSNRLATAGEHEQAFQAVTQAIEIHLRLAEANPAAYEPDLARSLNNLSLRLAEAGEHEQALQAIREAVAIRARLAEANPAAYEPDLARSLHNLAMDLVGAGLPEQALTAIQQAVDIYQRLVETNAAAFASLLEHARFLLAELSE